MGSEEKGEERQSTSSNTHAMAKGEASERNDTQKNMSAQAPCRVPQPGCTKCTSISQVLSGAVVTTRTEEMLWSKMVQSYKGSSTEEPKDGRRHGIHLPSIHSP
jgi:hypothetical protein